ncbi:MAG TPA: hypothetical protein DIT54_11410 [Lachnospiraceae bacterium]|nr:hypothetical protein [Lachnospiraceae bacterium]
MYGKNNDGKIKNTTGQKGVEKVEEMGKNKKEQKHKKKNDSSDLGKQIEDLVQDAIDNWDFDELSKSVGNTIKQWNDELNTSFQKSFSSTKKDIHSAWQDVKEDLFYAVDGAKKDVMRSMEAEKKRKELRNSRRKGAVHYGKKKIQEKIIEGQLEIPVRKRAPLKVKGTLYTVFASLCLAGFGIATLIFGILWMITGGFMNFFIGFLIPTILSAAFLGEGIELLQKNQRMMRYISLLRAKGYVDIKELAQYVGIKKRKVLKEVKEMLALGALPEGHLDRNETCLIGTDEIYHQYQELEQRRYENEKLEEERQKEQENMSEEMRYIFKEIEEGRRFIEEIRAVNRDISEPIISEKIARLENISEKIFQYVEENPAKVEEIRRLKNYYLPTMLKLVRTYEKLEDSDVSGANQKKIRTEIEDTLDTMNTALETMYDDLYSAEAMDVSADISVLKTILAREGLVKNELEKTKEEK